MKYENFSVFIGDYFEILNIPPQTIRTNEFKKVSGYKFNTYSFDFCTIAMSNQSKVRKRVLFITVLEQ